MEKVHFNLVGQKECENVIAQYPDYRVFWRSGYAFRGAGESEDDKQPRVEYDWRYRAKVLLDFNQRMQRRYDWAAAIDIDIDHDKKEIHFNGFSCNDLY